MAARSCSGGVVRSCIGVLITPGETAFTRMLSGANSLANARVKVETKAFELAVCSNLQIEQIVGAIRGGRGFAMRTAANAWKVIQSWDTASKDGAQNDYSV
jgi:hypothetical protein